MNIIDKIQKGDFIMFYSDGNVNKTYWGILTDGNKIVALSDGRSHNVDSEELSRFVRLIRWRFGLIQLNLSNMFL